MTRIRAAATSAPIGSRSIDWFVPQAEVGRPLIGHADAVTHLVRCSGGKQSISPKGASPGTEDLGFT